MELADALKALSDDVLKYGEPALTMRYACAYALKILNKIKENEIMKQYRFTVSLYGDGDTPDAAWKDAVNQFGLDPHGMPDNPVEYVNGEPVTSEQKTIKVVLACTNASGGPEFTFSIIQCSAREYKNGYHYSVAETWAKAQGYEGPFVCFDEHDGPAFLFEHFNWATATTLGPPPKGV